MKDIKTVLLFALSGIILFLVFFFPNKIIQLKNTQSLIIKNVADTQSITDFYHSNFDLNQKMLGVIAPDFLCKEYLTEEILLSGMVKEKPLLIFRFKEQSCTPCYIEELNTLQQILTENKDYVKIFSSFSNFRSLMILINKHDITMSTYLIPFDAFDWPAEENDKPYYFVLHPNMKISHIYVPDKVFPELNKQYLEGIM